MKLSKTDILNSELPAGKVLVKIIEPKEVLANGIYIPNSSNIKDGEIVKISRANNSTYYDINLNKRLPINLKEGDIVKLNFVSNFTKFKVEEDTYFTTNPSNILAIYNKKYYKLSTKK